MTAGLAGMFLLVFSTLSITYPPAIQLDIANEIWLIMDMGAERTVVLDPGVSGQIQEVISAIDSQEVVDDLLALAAIGGERLEPTADHPIDHIATNRLALTETDIEARQSFIKPRMHQAGMDVLDDNPMGIIGIYPGIYEELEPVLVLSHTDTVPKGDIYDGTLGVVAALKAVKAMHERGIHAERDIIVASATLEESSRFGAALLGSRALFHGLTAEELDLHKSGDLSVREALGEKGAKVAGVPYFGPNGHLLPAPYAAIELHVEQDRKLVDAGIDLGVVDRIASPVRYKAMVGELPLTPDTARYPHERYLSLTVRGQQNHSGATPMGVMNRADGLVETARLLDGLLEDQGDAPVLAVGDIEVADSAMNKVPGLTSTSLRLAAGSEQAVEEAYYQLRQALESRAALLRAVSTPFPDEPFELREISRSAAGTFFPAPEMIRRQRAAFALISSVDKAALAHAEENVVGTVASFATGADGTISLEVDIRGIELESRDRAVARLNRLMSRDSGAFDVDYRADVNLGDPLPGSGESPVALDERLVGITLDTIDRFDIGSAQPMFSAAGHDTQNVARAGIPSVMIFARSEGGIAHNPDAYTKPDNIGRAVRAQTAMMIRLANEVPDLV
jgi:acetylornithine deacetylase/succinyl-diaminopimelate desuccinylase-like protein